MYRTPIPAPASGPGHPLREAGPDVRDVRTAAALRAALTHLLAGRVPATYRSVLAH